MFCDILIDHYVYHVVLMAMMNLEYFLLIFKLFSFSEDVICRQLNINIFYSGGCTRSSHPDISSSTAKATQSVEGRLFQCWLTVILHMVVSIVTFKLSFEDNIL